MFVTNSVAVLCWYNSSLLLAKLAFLIRIGMFQFSNCDYEIFFLICFLWIFGIAALKTALHVW